MLASPISELADTLPGRPQRSTAPGRWGQKGDVEAAGKETGVQAPVAAVGKGDAQLVPMPPRSPPPPPSGCSALWRSGQETGIVSRVTAARPNSAVASPKPAISHWDSGAKTNCPKEPPALMKPDAKAAASAGRRATAPSSTEKLRPAGRPATSTPRHRVSPRLLSDEGRERHPGGHHRGPTNSEPRPETVGQGAEQRLDTPP